ncbi:MAG: pyrimidine operon attenuation protein/uracil phosphoribosyltransferase [Verrucomicrobiales bacterium]|jgi:pyrimidine operon attenuation protein/uracil phosphoribosyltransferase
MATEPDSQVLLQPVDIANKTRRLALQILERHPHDELKFVGIHTRGVIVGERVRELLREDLGEIPFGTLDISLYRDDLDNMGAMPNLKGTDIPFSIDDSHIILFDDVLFTGRTIKAAIDALTDYGRPKSIELAVLIDRGNRELPIAPNYVGLEVSTTKQDYVRVRLRETDDEEGIYLTKKQ